MCCSIGYKPGRRIQSKNVLIAMIPDFQVIPENGNEFIARVHLI
jgi:hypothetical protein